jgi:adenylate cyclase
MIKNLFNGLSKTINTQDYTHLLRGFVCILNEQGVFVDRLQIPMNKYSGLRHPRYATILLNHVDNQLSTLYITHEAQQQRLQENADYLTTTPFAPVLDRTNVAHRLSLAGEVEYERLRELQIEGYTDYASVSMLLPNGNVQLFSIATKNTDGFCVGLESKVESLLPMFALCLYGAYQTDVASALAETYLGARTAENVLTGSIYRGSQDTLDAGIMFCDVRGFTAMSEKLGAEGVVKVMNDIFQIIEEEISPRNGEILKFIGDALLVVFPRCSEVSDEQVSENMIQSALQSVIKVEELGRQLNLPLSVGFGCHLGTVLYGNIGTETRLDFTVMGPAVNLTSRLESMCKSLGAQLTVSSQVAKSHKAQLRSFGVHSLKGVAGPVEIWGVLAST